MVADKYKDYMYNLIKKVVDEIGPREPCGEGEKKLARMLAAEWKPICDKVDLQDFTCSPTAFLGFFPVLNILYILAAAIYWFLPPLAFFIAFGGFCVLFFQFVRYKELLDPLYPKGNSMNAVGTIKPRGEVKRRLIICGHIDSAYEFNLWLLLKNWASPLMVLAILAVLFLVGVTLVKSISLFTGWGNPAIFMKLGIAIIALYPLVAPFTFFHTYTPVPGAMDDMAGVSVAAGLGKYIDDSKKDGSYSPENTEVVLLGMGCEEAGLRGAKRFVEKNMKELKAIPTHTIMFDGIYDEKYLTVMSSEICTGAKHDPKLVNLIMGIAKGRGWKAKRTFVPIGASDASVFSKSGLSATTICCQDTTKLVPNYHTRYDTMEHIRPESLAVSLQIAIDALEHLDKNGL